MNDADRDPFDQLVSSHRRLEENLIELTQAAHDITDPPRQADALQTIQDVIGYFDRSVARHEQDEELSLFPRLEGFQAMAPIILTLRQEHDEQRRLVEQIRALLTSDSDTARADLLSASKALAAAYHRHIACEEQQLFPVARNSLSSAELSSIAAEMQARRGQGGRGRGGRNRQ